MSRRARASEILAAVAAAALVAAAVALASGHDGPRKPTRSHSPLVSLGQPITPYRAGAPARGWIEMRAQDPDGGPRRAVLFHRLRHASCAEHGIESQLRRYPVRDGGSCVERGQSAPLMWGIGSGTDQPVALHGQAAADVERIVLAGPGGTYDVALSRHRTFLVLYSAKAKGRATLTAHLRDGGTRFHEFALPPDFLPPGSAEAPDPAGLPAWTVSAEERVAGVRAGQTCAQFQQRQDIQAPPGRQGGEFGAPLCGDLDAHPLFADATAYGPRPGVRTFGPGPRSPRRLIVWGAVSPEVREVRVSGPDGTRELALSRIGRAFIAVYPGSVAAQDVTVEATLADGRTLRHTGPQRINSVAVAERPRLVGSRMQLTVSPAGTSRLVLSATLTRTADRFVVKLQRRRVRMRRSGGTGARPRYVGSFEDRPRAFRPGRIYRTTVFLCGDGCSTTLVRVRVR